MSSSELALGVCPPRDQRAIFKEGAGEVGSTIELDDVERDGEGDEGGSKNLDGLGKERKRNERDGEDLKESDHVSRKEEGGRKEQEEGG
jgi:hypothetical protein